MDTYSTPAKGLPRSVVAVIGMLLLAGVLTIALVRDRIVSPPWREVTITGTGRVPYTPDEALVRLGVHVDTAPTAQAALGVLSMNMEKIIPALQELGIPEENISTESYNLYPQYYYPENRPAVISGYGADQQLTVKLTGEEGVTQDLVSRVIETASASGANQILGVSFTASNIDELHQEALLLAIQDAQSRAEETADAAGVRLKKVVSWWENPIYLPGSTMSYDYYAKGGEMGMGGGYAPQVPSGEQEIVIQVNLNYSTK
ncbi:MAG: hypothetical protein AMXMBFR44_4310 [Candidatus Campbellbacteria bacterium]